MPNKWGIFSFESKFVLDFYSTVKNYLKKDFVAKIYKNGDQNVEKFINVNESVKLVLKLHQILTYSKVNVLGLKNR